MSATDEQRATSNPLAEGSWRVDPMRSELSFQARGTFGLIRVRGTFQDYGGELTVTDGAARGELRIEAASLDTGNAMRDKHLRSPDFFDVDKHDKLTFTLLDVTQDASKLTLRGVLRIKGTELEVSAPLQASAQTGQITLSTDFDVERAAAGVGWSKAGMIKGPAHLNAALMLVSD